jgi:hypothetical protein
MPPTDDVQPAALRSSQYFSTAGPTAGPVFRWDDCLMLDVVDAPDSVRTIGTAQATG